MSGVKGFSIGPVKVKEMRQMISSGQFANWIAKIKDMQKCFKTISPPKPRGLSFSHARATYQSDIIIIDDFEVEENEKSKA